MPPKLPPRGAPQIFSVGPGGEIEDPSAPKAVNDIAVVSVLRSRRDRPSALVALADGRYALASETAVAIGDRRAVARWCERRAQRVGSDDPAAQELGAQAVDLDTLLSESDFVSIHVPLMPETHHLIDARALKRMKSTAILINTARGPVVDPAALYQALKGGEIAYAALDVTEPEPINVDNPLIELPNCIIVPHIASGSIATRTRMAEIAARNLIAGVRGEPLPAWVNPEVKVR